MSTQERELATFRLGDVELRVDANLLRKLGYSVHTTGEVSGPSGSQEDVLIEALARGLRGDDAIRWAIAKKSERNHEVLIASKQLQVAEANLRASQIALGAERLRLRTKGDE